MGAPNLNTGHLDLVSFLPGLEISLQDFLVAQQIFMQLTREERIRLASHTEFEIPVEKIPLHVTAHYRDHEKAQLALDLISVISPLEEIRSFYIYSVSGVSEKWIPLMLDWYQFEPSQSVKLGILNAILSLPSDKALQRFYYGKVSTQDPLFLDGLLRWATAQCLKGVAHLPNVEENFMRLLDYPPAAFAPVENRRAIRILMAHAPYFRMRASAVLTGSEIYAAEMPTPFDFYWYMPGNIFWSPDRQTCAQFIKGPNQYSVDSPYIGRLAVAVTIIDHCGGPLVWSQDGRYLMATQRMPDGEHYIIIIDTMANKISKLDVTIKTAYPLQFTQDAFWLLRANILGVINPLKDLLRVSL